MLSCIEDTIFIALNLQVTPLSPAFLMDTKIDFSSSIELRDYRSEKPWKCVSSGKKTYQLCVKQYVKIHKF